MELTSIVIIIYYISDFLIETNYLVLNIYVANGFVLSDVSNIALRLMHYNSLTWTCV